MSRLSGRTAEQAGHLFFEVVVEVLFGGGRGLRLCLSLRFGLGLRPGLESWLGLLLGFGDETGFGPRLRILELWRLELRLDTRLEVTQRRTRLDRLRRRYVDLRRERIGHRRTAIRRRGAAQGCF